MHTQSLSLSIMIYNTIIMHLFNRLHDIIQSSFCLVIIIQPVRQFFFTLHLARVRSVSSFNCSNPRISLFLSISIVCLSAWGPKPSQPNQCQCQHRAAAMPILLRFNELSNRARRRPGSQVKFDVNLPYSDRVCTWKDILRYKFLPFPILIQWQIDPTNQMHDSSEWITPITSAS